LLGEYDAFGFETEVVVAIDLVFDGVGGGFCVCELSALSGTDGGAKKQFAAHRQYRSEYYAGLPATG
jgi:hypothetical protein